MEWEKEITILHLSDLHFGKYNQFMEKESVFIDCCRTIIKKLKEFYKEKGINKASLLLISGDIGSTSDENDYNSESSKINAANFLFTYFKEYLPSKIVIVPGNHDLKWAIRRGARQKYKFSEYYDFIKMIGLIKGVPQYYSNPHFYKYFKKLNTIVLGLNSCMFTSYNNDTEEARHHKKYRHRSLLNEDKLLQILIKINDIHPKSEFLDPTIRIVMMHHNVYPFEENSVELINSKNGLGKSHITLIKKLHDDYNFDVIIHGHRHENFLININNSLIIGGGSVFVNRKNKTFAMGEKNDHARNNTFNVIHMKKEVDMGKKYKHIVMNVEVSHFQINYDTDYSVKYVGSDKKSITSSKEVYDPETNQIIDIIEQIRKNPKNVTLTLEVMESSKGLKDADKNGYYNQLVVSYRRVYKEIGDVKSILAEIFQEYESEKNQQKPENAKLNLIKKLALIPKNKRELVKEIQNYLPKTDADKILKHKDFKDFESTIRSYGIVDIPDIGLSSPISTTNHSFSWSPIRRLMKQQGASIVAREAVDLLIDHLEKTAYCLTEQAKSLTRHAKRKKITKEDLILAIKYK